MLGKTAARHTSAEFVAFLSDIVAHQPKGKKIHVIADNLSAHKTQRVAHFLSEHPNRSIHYTPTYSSWLNQVELWFAKIERDVIARGVFTSVNDLARKLMRYIREYNKAPKTVKWKYFDPCRRITTESVRPLVRDKVEVIVVTSTQDAQAAKRVTSTIPIVMVVVSDPIGSGLVKSLSHPGGNITGLTIMTPDLSAKRLQH